MRRILVEVIGVKEVDGIILNAMYFGFAYTIVALVVPDHFVISQMLLLLTFYICGTTINNGERLGIIKTIVLFVLTAGVTLSNGVKVYLAALFTNKWRFFRPGYLLLGVLLPAALMWAFAKWDYNKFVLPDEQAWHKAVKAKKAAQRRADLEKYIKLYAEQTGEKDSAKIAKGGYNLYRQHNWEVHNWNIKNGVSSRIGKPLAQEGFMKWTDVSTDRRETVIHNFFGETIQLHQDYLLEDTLRSRPVIVKYRWWINYRVELLIIILFIIGIWIGRKNRFLWLVLSCFAFDAALHLGLGFGINEVYIMGPHWLFVIPIAIAYIFRHTREHILKTIRISIIFISLWLWLYNGVLLINFFIS